MQLKRTISGPRGAAAERKQQQAAGATSRRVVAQARAGQSLAQLTNIRQLRDLKIDDEEVDLENLRDVKGVSYVSRRRMDDASFDPEAVDEDGLPLVYNERRIADFWGKRPGELVGRWTRFTAVSAPWLTKLANVAIQGKLQDPQRQAELARDAVENLEKLGPTFIKLGQIMSIRPDVLPPSVMKELARLQDRIPPFDTADARRMVDAELGRPLDEVFSEFSEKPIAAASLAQVYRARLRETGQEVAVKVQRPGALGTISKDLYVMRRAVGVYEQLVKRFTAQTTDYQQLLSTFAEGLYTEMDFRNEALNSLRMRELLDSSEFAQSAGSVGQIVIPRPLLELTTRRVMTMQWITGVKLTTLPPEEVQQLVKVGQAAFLTQLLEVGFMHGDPHPGNLLKVTEGPDAGKLALLDFGLVAEIPQRDRQAMVAATIHLANRDWSALIDDFVALGFLPRDCDRALIIPVMDRVLSPYLRGGGAKAFNFQALSQDLLAATLEIPFSVPPYMSLLARSVATLEGIALVGDPNYQMVAQAYPFVVRKVLRNDSRGAALLLRDILYDSDSGGIKATRLGALLNAALGYVAEDEDVKGFIDLDTVPDDGASPQEIFAFLLSPEARDLRPLLISQLVEGLDLALRDRLRRAAQLTAARLTPRLPFIGSLPVPPAPPIFVPGVGLRQPQEVLDLLAPPLAPEEQVFLKSLTELAAGLMGVPPSDLEEPSPASVLALLTSPTQQLRELTGALAAAAGQSDSSSVVAREVAVAVLDGLAQRQAERAGPGVTPQQLFPLLGLARSALQRAPSTPPATRQSSHSTASTSTSTSSTAASTTASATSGAQQHQQRGQQQQQQQQQSGPAIAAAAMASLVRAAALRNAAGAAAGLAPEAAPGGLGGASAHQAAAGAAPEGAQHPAGSTTTESLGQHQSEAHAVAVEAAAAAPLPRGDAAHSAGPATVEAVVARAASPGAGAGSHAE